MRRLGPAERLGYGRVLVKLVDSLAAGKPVFSGAVPVVSGMAEIKRRLMIKNHLPASIAACVVTLAVWRWPEASLCGRGALKPDRTPPEALKFLKAEPAIRAGRWSIGDPAEQEIWSRPRRWKLCTPWSKACLTSSPMGVGFCVASVACPQQCRSEESGRQRSNAIPALLRTKVPWSG